MKMKDELYLTPNKKKNKIEKMNCIVGVHSGRHVCFGGLIMVWSDSVWWNYIHTTLACVLLKKKKKKTLACVCIMYRDMLLCVLT